MIIEVKPRGGKKKLTVWTPDSWLQKRLLIQYNKTYKLPVILKVLLKLKLILWNCFHQLSLKKAPF